MIIEIHDTKTIEDIRDKFNTFFPFLKIEFFEHPHHWYEDSLDKTPYSIDKKIGEIRKQHAHGELEIHSWNKTGDMEQTFRKKFGLHVQVFRMEGNNWIQTAGTDKLDLAEQNEIGKKVTAESRQGMNSKTEKRSLF